MTKTEQSEEADILIAMDVAQTAEREACQLIVDCVEEMCSSPAQKNKAIALITAAMIEKFEGSKYVTSPAFKETVEQLQAKLKESGPGGAVFFDHEDFRPLKTQSRWAPFIDFYMHHPFVANGAIVAVSWMVFDIIGIIVKLAS